MSCSDLREFVDAELEAVILGTILADGEPAYRQVDFLAPEDFTSEAHRVTFATIQKLAPEVNATVDAVTHVLIQENKIEAVGGVARLMDLHAQAISGLKLGGFAQSLRTKTLDRRAIRLADKVTQAVELGFSTNPVDVIAAAEEICRLNGEGVGTKAGIGLPRVRTGEDLYNCTTPDIRPLVRVKASGEALLMDGLSIFAARQKAGKSWEALQLAIAVAGGPDHEGLDVVEHGQVLYLALEEPAVRTSARIRKLAPPGDWLQRLAFVYELLPLMGGGADQLRELIRQHRPRLVVLDTLTALIKSGGKRDNDVFRSQYAEVSELRKMAEEFRAAFLLIHHLRKGLSGDPVEAVAGTGGITAACDSILILKRKPEGRAELEVTGREISERSYALQFGTDIPFGWRFIGDGAVLAMSEEQREVVELLRDDGGLTPAQVAAELSKSRGGVRIMLKRMAEDGKVEKSGKVYRLPSLSMSNRGNRERVGN